MSNTHDAHDILEVLGGKGFAARANFARSLFEARGVPVPSQSWLARRASSFLPGDEISQSAVARWLSGDSIPDTPLRLWAFATALGVDPGWLAFGEVSNAPAASLLESVPYATPVVGRGFVGGTRKRKKT